MTKYRFLPSLKQVTSNLFDNFFNDVPDIYSDFGVNKNGYFAPTMDISTTDDAYCVELDLPGMTKDNIDIKIDNNLLTIKGNKSEEKETKKKDYYSRERSYGEFYRSVSLPSNIDESKIAAQFRDGVLEISIPKKETSTSRSVEIS